MGIWVNTYLPIYRPDHLPKLSCNVNIQKLLLIGIIKIGINRILKLTGKNYVFIARMLILYNKNLLKRLKIVFYMKSP